MVRFTVNGVEQDIPSGSGRTLLDLLRDDLRLTGAKYGCGEGRCGACTVLVNGTPTHSCVVTAETLEDARVTTVEGLADDGGLHPVQRAFVERRALQCGYCSPGMVVTAAALLARDSRPDESTIRTALAGNVCRCGGYPRIVEAVRAASAADAVATASPPREPQEGAGGGGDAVWTFTLPSVDPAVAGWGWSTPGGVRLTIDRAGRVHAYVGKVDGGQGNRYSLIRIVAAEMGVPTRDVEVTMGDTALSPFDLGTFGSRSTPDAGRALRVVAAAARRVLAAEAGPGGGSYGAVVEKAGSRTVTVRPDEPVPAVTSRGSDVDSDAARLGLTAAVTGAKRFPSDLALPGMLHGRVLRPPAYGAALRAADTTAARGMPGVTVVEEGGFVAVAAPTAHLAAEALRAIDCEWTPGTGPSERDLESYLRSHPVEERGWGGAVDHAAGDADAARAAAHVTLEATYRTAYIAHVPLEPRVALAEPARSAVTVWAGTQRPFAVRNDVAAAVGLPEEKVRVIVPDFGGGFGGKHTGDVAVEAARLACATGRPVRVAWTREEEFRHAYFRPAAVIDVRSSADAAGTITGWEFTNVNSGAAALFSPYDVPNQRVRFRPADSPLPQGSYRALAATANTFARESHIDEVATALGADAVELRLRHLPDPRLADVLRAVAEHIGWPAQPADARAGVGIACGQEKDARVASAAEVRVDSRGGVELRRLVTALDCGAVVDPDGLRLQVVGATIMGLGGALFEAVHFDAGRILNASLTDYRVPRFPDVPPIEVLVLDRPDIASAGAGETPIIAVAPAIANAIHAATGQRMRSLPLAPGLD